MNHARVFVASAAIEWAQLKKNKAFILLTAIAAVSFLVMVCLFGLTGSNAPMALINRDGSAYSQRMIEALVRAHNSFALKYLTDKDAERALAARRLVGIITIPKGFGEAIQRGETVPIDVKLDNVDIDMTSDVQRALPAAIVAFGNKHNFPGIRVQMVEHDVINHETGYIPYLVVSALALDALVIAGVLGAMATAREWERKTIKLLRLSPSHLAVVLAGKLTVAALVASAVLLLTLLVIIYGYGVSPHAPLATFLGLEACVIIFTCFGAWLGATVKRTLAAVPLLFGLAMPLYVDSGALEPTRFDGELIWRIAHASPVYYAVGVLEWAFHGLHVTPEPVYADMLILLAIAGLAVWLTLGQVAKAGRR